MDLDIRCCLFCIDIPFSLHYICCGIYHQLPQSLLLQLIVEGIHIDIYGHIVDDFKEKFEKFIDENNNVTYQGVFDATKNNVYEKLHEYDILLFPSRWKGEGVPGILIESKMAGIVPIVSDHLYNSEIVLNNIEGIVL